MTSPLLEDLYTKTSGRGGGKDRRGGGCEGCKRVKGGWRVGG